MAGLDNRVGRIWESCEPLGGYIPVLLLSCDACRARFKLCGAPRLLWSGHMVPGGQEGCSWPFALSGGGVDPHGLKCVLLHWGGPALRGLESVYVPTAFP